MSLKLKRFETLWGIITRDNNNKYYIVKNDAKEYFALYKENKQKIILLNKDCDPLVLLKLIDIDYEKESCVEK